MTNNKGYTLIEMLVALSLLLIVLLGGTLLFTQNLRTGGLTEIDLSLNNTARSLLDELERSLRFSKIRSVDDTDRDECLELGELGYEGTTVTVEDINGLEIRYGLQSNRVASFSGIPESFVYLHNDSVNINSLVVKWYCQSGINDKINLEMSISSTVLGSGVTITKTVSRDILLVNGAIY